jgi:hypothetical protein
MVALWGLVRKRGIDGVPERFMRVFFPVIFGFSLLTGSTLPAAAKSGSTIYTAAKVTNARNNIATTSWAQQERDGVVGYASYWMNLSDDQLWELPLEQSVPRATYVHKTLGCPIHGTALIDRYGVYGWKVDPVFKPFKVQCPIGGETWPTNDYAKFYNSGKNANHLFDAARANRSLLVSSDPARNYGVDDGTGYVDGNGNRFSFIAYYNHWGVWQNMGRSWNQALLNLGEAYVLTGNPAYAHKAAILLNRIADLLPTMDTHYWSNLGYPQGDGNSGQGLALGSIWDAALGSAIARAYDAIYPALANDPALFTFLAAKSSQYGLTVVNSPAAFHQHIGQHALTVLLQAIQARRVRANEGIYQRTYAEVAIALDDPAQTPNWLNWLQQPGTPYDGGGHLPTVMVDAIDRDGGSDDASPGYTAIWQEALQPLGDLLQDSPYAAGYSLTQYANFRNFLSFPFWLQVMPSYYPHIGDESSTGSPGTAPGNDPNRYAAAFNRYGFAEYAQMAYALNGNSSAGLHGSIYDPGAAATASAIDNVVAAQGPIQRGPLLLSGYGLATLTGTAGGKDASIWLYSGRQNKHGHWDRLNLGLFAYGLDLAPDLGYPDFPNVDSPNYWGWQNNTVAHNTVVVNASRQSTVPSGATKAYLTGQPIQFIEKDGNGVYANAGAGTYLRSVLRIPTAGGFYLVDLFRVQGGGDHLYSFHGGPGNVATTGLNLAQQSGGTYAGAGISFGQFYDGACCTSYMGSGFSFLDNVSRDNAPQGAFRAEWSVVDNWHVLPAAQDTRLRVWSVGDQPSSVALADGDPPSNKPGNPASIRYLLERRVGAAPLTSTFVHVIEPYVGAAQVVSVTRFTPSPVADSAGFPRSGLHGTLADGHTDSIVLGLTPAAVSGDGVTLNGRGGVLRRLNGASESAYLIGGADIGDGTRTLASGAGIWSATVQTVDASDPNHIRLTVSGNVPAGSWAGRYLRVAHAGGHDPFYRIESAANAGSSAVIDLGRVNIERGFADTTNYANGKLLDVAAGDMVESQSDAFGLASDAVVPPPEPTPTPTPEPTTTSTTPATSTTTTATTTTTTTTKPGKVPKKPRRSSDLAGDTTAPTSGNGGNWWSCATAPSAGAPWEYFGVFLVVGVSTGLRRRRGG